MKLAPKGRLEELETTVSTLLSTVVNWQGRIEALEREVGERQLGLDVFQGWQSSKRRY